MRGLHRQHSTVINAIGGPEPAPALLASTEERNKAADEQAGDKSDGHEARAVAKNEPADAIRMKRCNSKRRAAADGIAQKNGAFETERIERRRRSCE